MRFYIDFENVGCGGLKGIENLKGSDIVVIYYSNNPSLNMDTVEKIVQTKAKIEFQKLSDEIKNMNLKNALDIVILNDISRLISSQCNEWVIIVSNDGGYDATVNSYIANGKQLKRVASISKAANLPSQTKKKSSGEAKIDEQGISALFKKELSAYSSHKQEIINIIKISQSRSQINDMLAKKFQKSSHVGKIMKAIKPFIKKLPGK